jgi:Holliday junction resolvase
MAKINSKKKGSKNERDVCKWWKEWTGYDFSRVPSSGGLRWSRTTDTTGDIICSDQKHFLKFPFSIEAKNYKDLNFEHLLLGNKNIQILDFWHQAEQDAVRGKKVPILMMRYNGMKKGEYFFVVNSKLYQLLEGTMTSKLKKDIPRMVITTRGAKDSITITLASDILNLPYKEVYKLVRKQLKSN